MPILRLTLIGAALLVPANWRAVDAGTDPAGPGAPGPDSAAPASETQRAPTAASARTIRTPLEVPLELNGKFLGSIEVEVDNAGAGAIDTARLLVLLRPALGAQAFSAIEARIAGRPQVEFADLSADSFQIAFDPLQLTVKASLAASDAATTAIGIVQRTPPPDPAQYDQQAPFAIGFNIGATQSYLHSGGGDLREPNIFVGGIANIGGFTGVTLTGGVEYLGSNGSDPWQRREFRLTKDFYQSAVRLTAGEFTPLIVGYQGSGRILGLSVERAYGTIRPFQNVRPAGRQTFTLERSSTVDVFVNDVRTETLRLDAGRYDIRDFPFANGPNRVRLEVDDVGGRREIAAFDIFNDNNLLNPGITEFALALGLRESDKDFTYGAGPVFSAFGQTGLSDTLTAGAHAQATRLGAQLGLLGGVGTPIGFFQTELAASRNAEDGKLGAAVTADYRGDFSLRRPNDFGVVVTGFWQTRRFQNAFDSFRRNPQIWNLGAQLRWQAPWQLSLSSGYTYTKSRNGQPDIQSALLSLGRSFGGLALSGNLSRNQTGKTSEWLGSLNLSLAIGPRWRGLASYESGPDRKTIEISRSTTGFLDDVSGDLRLVADRASRSLAGRVGYINNRFDAQVRHDTLQTIGASGSQTSQTVVSFGTFIGYADGAIGIGRQVRDGFIIAPRHRSLSDQKVEVKSGSKVVARSDWLGPPVLAIDRAFGVQRNVIEVDDLPPGYDLGSASFTVFPGYGAGYKQQIGSDASRVAVGTIVAGDGPMARIGGTIERIEPAPKPGATRDSRPFFTNLSGRFVADRLSPGRYGIMVAGKMIGTFSIDPKQEGMVNVGTIAVIAP